MNTLLAIFYETIAPIFLIIFVTILVGRNMELNPRTLSRVSIYIMSPALILHNITTSGMSPGTLSSIVLAAMVFCVVMAGVGLALARLFRFERETASAFILTVFIMNTVNFGFPFIEFAFGSEGLETAVVFSVGQILAAYLLGTYIASRGRTTGKVALRNALTIPMLYTFLLAMLLNSTQLTLPSPILKASEVLGRGIVPLALVILGLQLSSARLKGHWKPILVAMGARFFIAAAVAAGIALLFGLEGLNRQVFILEASMPAGVLSGVLTTEFGGDAELAAATILVTTIASALFLPLLLLLVGA